MMRFKIKTTAGAALAVATVAAFISIVFGVVLALQPTSILICSCGLFVLLFFAAHYLFNLFVRYRIKPIYQVLLSKNIRTHDLPPTHDLVSGLQDELNLWAEKNAREIARLKENERYRKEFLGNVSHEIKTPIFTIQGYILTLLDGGLEDENINRKYLERSEKSIDRLINIVQDLEEISKLESGSLVLEPERFDIVALVQEIAESIEIEAAARHITFRIGTSNFQPPVLVYADRRKISQVIMNLLINSVRYGRDNGTTTVSFVDMYDRVMIEVADNGVGIAEEYIPRVFERFFRVDKSRSREQGGTGLGLAIVKHILEAHGQVITLRSKLGEGSTFSFALAKEAPKANPVSVTKTV